ncbi:hypothetical protein MRB53_040832 [Persea americana]|nr:hypothetical protein MRB53_040832 [Persea americana]
MTSRNAFMTSIYKHSFLPFSFFSRCSYWALLSSHTRSRALGTSKYQQVDDASISDESEEIEHDIFTRASSKAPDIQVAEYFAKPRFEAAIKAIEIFGSVALVGINIACVVLLPHKLSSIVQLIFWTAQIGCHTTHFPIPVHHRNLSVRIQYHLVVVAVTSRLSDEAYARLSIRGLPASQEPLASLFSRAGFSWVNPCRQDYVELNRQAIQSFQVVTADAGRLGRHVFTLYICSNTIITGHSSISRRSGRHSERGCMALLLWSEVAWLYCFGLLAGSLLTTVGNGQALFLGRRICIKLRAIIIGEVYAKALRRRDVSAAKSEEDAEGQANNGQIINLMAIDAFKVAEISAYLHYLLASVPIEIVIAVALLYGILGWSALAGIVVFEYTKRFDEDYRCAYQSYERASHSIRIVKYFAWEQSFIADIDECRRQELIQLRRRFIMYSISSLSWHASPILITLLTFWSYTKLAGNELTASVAFTALSLFNVLKNPLDQLADMITNVLQSKVSLDRVANFLAEEDTQKYDHLYNEKKATRTANWFQSWIFLLG